MSFDHKPSDDNASDAGATADTGPADWTVRKGGKDRHEAVVIDIVVSTERFMIYTSANGSNDCERLRYVLPDGYDDAKDMRAKLTPIVGELTQVGNVIAGLPGERSLFGMSIGHQYASLRKRTLDLMGRAMQAAFEDQPKAALDLVSRACDEVVSRRDSRNRMRYIFANSVALAVILYIWTNGGIFGWTLPDQLMQPHSSAPGAFTAAGGVVATGSTVGDAGATFRAIDVLAVGALGAFFAVSASINKVRVNHTISVWEMIYAGFVRVPIGVIAAGIVIFLISGGWILASISPEYRLPSLYLFGFLAGFSELFVPNALKQVESSTRSKPAGPTTADPDPE